jgi:hypothetical protein
MMVVLPRLTRGLCFPTHHWQHFRDRTYGRRSLWLRVRLENTIEHILHACVFMFVYGATPPPVTSTASASTCGVASPRNRSSNIIDHLLHPCVCFVYGAAPPPVTSTPSGLLGAQFEVSWTSFWVCWGTLTDTKNALGGPSGCI